MPAEVVFEESQTERCSFCGRERAQLPALVGPTGGSAICTECIGLCCDIIIEEGVKEESWDEPERPPRSGPNWQGFLEYARKLEEGREEHRRRYEEWFARSGRSEPYPEHRCSFCNMHRREVAKLISGPHVFICERCIALAITAAGLG